MKRIGEVMTELRTKSGKYTPLDRDYWVRPCPWCDEILEPKQDSGGYWIPGLVGHSCAGYEEEKAGQAERQAIREQEKDEERWATICKQAGMTEFRLEKTFETFERHKQPEAYDTAEAFFAGPESLLFCGPRGTGKTHLASAILHRWLRIGFDRQADQPSALYPGGRGFFIELPVLLRRIQATYKERYPEQTEDSIIEFLTRLPLLVLDDMGKEKDSEFSRRILFALVDGCYVRKTHVIITSNKSGYEELIKVMGAATYSRMLEMGQIVTMKGGYDYRQQMSAARRAGG